MGSHERDAMLLADRQPFLQITQRGRPFGAGLMQCGEIVETDHHADPVAQRALAFQHVEHQLFGARIVAERLLHRRQIAQRRRLGAEVVQVARVVPRLFEDE